MPDFDVFCAAMSPKLVGALVVQLGDRARAEDVAQEALARAWVRWPEVSTMTSPEGWVFTVAFNLQRSAGRRGRAEERANARAPRSSVVVMPDVADRLSLVEALASMPARQRMVIALRYYAGLSVAESAQVMGCAEGTVKSLTSHAMSRLRFLLDELDSSSVMGGDAS